MAEYRQNDAAIWVSSRRETTFNTPYTAGAGFLKATTQQPVVLIPQMEKSTDEGRAGNGHEFATAICNEYWSPPALSLQDRAGFDLAGRLLLRALGGAVTDTTVVASTAYKHAANMLPIASGLQLPGSTVISELGGASFLFPGCVVDRVRMSQEGVAPVQLQFDLLGTGKHRSPHAVTSLPAAPTFSCLKPKSFLEYTDDVGLQQLANLCTVRSWFIEVANNHAPADDRCIGDSTQNAGDYTASGGASDAAYNSKLSRGSRVVTAQIVILLDSTMPQWLKMASNTALTNITFGARGNVLDGAGPTYESAKLIIPTGTFRAVEEQDSNGKAALALNFLAKYDSSSGGAVKAEVVNSTASNFD